MKNSFKSLVLALGAVVFTLPALRAQANPAGGPPDGQREMRREKMGERAADELGLSADQKTQMQALNQAQKTELEALQANTVLSKEDKRAQGETIRKSYMEKRQSIMTPEQREKAKGMREKMGNKMKERRGEGRGEGRPGKNAQPK